MSLIREMFRSSIDEVQRAYDERVKIEHGAASYGDYEAVEADGPITPDGREVVRIKGVAYALRPEAHSARLAAAFEDAKKAKDHATKSVVGTESLSIMACPKCGDALQHSAVCPKCAAGKLGYRHRYTCVCGAVDLISKEML